MCALNIINIPFKNSGNTGNLNSTQKDIDRLFEDLKTSSNITLFFHGGLVPENEGFEIAERLSPVLREANTESIFIVWETGIWEALNSLIYGKFSSSKFKHSLDFIMRALGRFLKIQKSFNINGFNKTNDLKTKESVNFNAINFTSVESWVVSEFEKETPFSEFKVPLGNVRGNFSTYHTMLKNRSAFLDADDDMLDQIMKDMYEQEKKQSQFNDSRIKANNLLFVPQFKFSLPKLKLLQSIGKRVMSRIKKGSHHNVYAIVVEEILRSLFIGEIGESVWGNMKERGKKMWQANELQNIGNYFLEKLTEWKQSNPSVSINLIGHSAGSIAINHLLIKTKGSLDFERIIFLAPACRVNLFKKVFRTNEKLLQNLHIFYLSDKLEKNDSIFHIGKMRIYPHSLLYFVSGLLEGSSVDAPILGMQMHYSKLDSELRKLIHNYVSPNACTQSASHGDFDNEEKTLQSIVDILQS